MAQEDKHFFPIIDFYNENGKESRVTEIIESKTFDGFSQVTYKLIEGKEVSFVIK